MEFHLSNELVSKHKSSTSEVLWACKNLLENVHGKKESHQATKMATEQAQILQLQEEGAEALL